MKKFLLVALLVFAGKLSIAQERLDYYSTGTNNLLVNDFYRVDESCPTHFFMEGQNYWAPSPGVSISYIKIWVRGTNGGANDFYQENTTYSPGTIGTAYMDVYGLDFSQWASVTAHWEIGYSDDTYEFYEYEWTNGYWW